MTEHVAAVGAGVGVADGVGVGAAAMGDEELPPPPHEDSMASVASEAANFDMRMISLI